MARTVDVEKQGCNVPQFMDSNWQACLNASLCPNDFDQESEYVPEVESLEPYMTDKEDYKDMKIQCGRLDGECDEQEEY